MGRPRHPTEQIIGKLRDELLNGELFYTLWEAQVVIERWRQAYNQIRPHSALGYRPPAPEAIELEPMGAGQCFKQSTIAAAFESQVFECAQDTSIPTENHRK